MSLDMAFVGVAPEVEVAQVGSAFAVDPQVVAPKLLESYAYAAGATADSWTHLVGVYNAATRTAQLYVNGALAGTATGVTPWAATGDLVLGRGLYNGSRDDWLNGSVSGVQAYDYALTGNQVTALYQSIL
ncbi:LamG-like jellyroll fold domain-containing protein [Streptomyces sp. NPDC002491]